MSLALTSETNPGSSSKIATTRSKGQISCKMETRCQQSIIWFVSRCNLCFTRRLPLAWIHPYQANMSVCVEVDFDNCQLSLHEFKPCQLRNWPFRSLNGLERIEIQLIFPKGSVSQSFDFFEASSIQVRSFFKTSSSQSNIARPI